MILVSCEQSISIVLGLILMLWSWHSKHDFRRPKFRFKWLILSSLINRLSIDLECICNSTKFLYQITICFFFFFFFFIILELVSARFFFNFLFSCKICLSRYDFLPYRELKRRNEEKYINPKKYIYLLYLKNKLLRWYTWFVHWFRCLNRLERPTCWYWGDIVEDQLG